MLEIKLVENYYITSDTYNYILSKKKKTKEGKGSFINLAYHNTITGVLESFRRKYPRDKDIKSIKKLSDVLQAIDKRLAEIEKDLKEDNVEKFIEK